MSGRRASARLTPEAAQDYDDILLGSLEFFGYEQTRSYQFILDTGIATIGRFPFAGVQVFGTYRRKLVGSHALYYQVEEHEVVVIRILHQKRNVGLPDLAQ